MADAPRSRIQDSRGVEDAAYAAEYALLLCNSDENPEKERFYLDVMRSEYIRTAAAKGLTSRVVILKHALKNALVPIVTVAGLQTGILLGGTVVVEEVFTLPGIGRLVLWSIYQRDYPLTQSTILFIAVMFMAINLAVDVLYGYLDPRIRYSA